MPENDKLKLYTYRDLFREVQKNNIMDMPLFVIDLDYTEVHPVLGDQEYNKFSLEWFRPDFDKEDLMPALAYPGSYNLFEDEEYE